MRVHKGSLGCDIKLCGSLCCHNCAVLTEKEAMELVINVRREYNFELDLRKYFRRAKGEHGIYYAVKMIKGQCIFLNNPSFTLGCDNNYILAIILYRCYSFLAII